MDDDVARREFGTPGIRETETVDGDVAVDCVHATCAHRIEIFRRSLQFAAQTIEGVVVQDLALHAARSAATAATHDEKQFATGRGTEKSLDQRRADEPRRPGNGNAPPRQ